jgi:hypothetical protein
MEIMHGKYDGEKYIVFEAVPASSAVYRLMGMTERGRKEINGYFVKFVGFARSERENISIFEDNLDLIHPYLASVLGDVIQTYFFEYENETPLHIVINHLIKANPHGITRPAVKYPYLLKSFLYAVYCGMNAVTLWNGEKKETPLSLAMKNEGKDMFFYAHDSSFVKSYLYDHCFMETPPKAEKQGNYGEIYQIDGAYYFSINIQIGLRF